MALALSVALPSGRLAGQTPAAPSPARPRRAVPTIDTIVIVAHNVFEHDTPEQLGFLTRLANALHVRTRASVIRRTLLVNQGDPYDSARVAESGRALRALNVFRDVVIDTLRLNGRLALRVVTADGWSTKPQLNFATAGGSVTWQAGLEEDNVLGTATSLTALYTKTPDRSEESFLYTNPHFIGRRPRFNGLYQNFSDGVRGAWGLGVPFYETSAPYEIGTSGEAGTQRVLVFRDGYLADSTQRHALRFRIGGGKALHASSRGYARLWVSAAWRREDFAPESTTIVPRSDFATLGVGIDLARARFEVLEGFNTYARREDVNLSQTLRVGLWAAPRAWGYPAGEAGVGGEVSGQASSAWQSGFAVLRAAANGVFTGRGFDSTRVRAAVTVASQELERQTIVLHAEGGILNRLHRPGGEFDPWLDQTGPRLFAAHSFTGTRTAWVALEDRIVVSDDFWGLLGVGLAPFFDWGGAWYQDEPVRTGSDVGLAIRLGPTRAPRGDVEELAFGWRFGAGFSGARWALSLRHGIVF